MTRTRSQKADKTRGANRPCAYIPPEAEALLGRCSKRALMDMVWTLCALGTDESDPQMAARMAREMAIVLAGRGEQVPAQAKLWAEARIDSDPAGGFIALDVSDRP